MTVTHTYIFLLTLLLASCKDLGERKEAGEVLLGSTEVWVDESLKKIISQQEDVFEDAYKHAQVDINYAPEMDVKKKFYEDTLSAIIISHSIDSVDLKAFANKQIRPRQYRFGKSALAFIVHKSRTKVTYAYDEMISLLKGSGQIFAIENKRSGIAGELLTHTASTTLGQNIYALQSKEAILEWLDKYPDGIGIIDWSELSDEDDVAAQKLLERIGLIHISQKGKKSPFYSPEQGNLNGLYPFTRDLYVIRKYGKPDSALGFASFICEQRGQKIMLKAGLLPEYQTERWIEFKGLKDINVVE
jgi:phosphate transport system substrate-binding protein